MRQPRVFPSQALRIQTLAFRLAYHALDYFLDDPFADDGRPLDLRLCEEVFGLLLIIIESKNLRSQGL